MTILLKLIHTVFLVSIPPMLCCAYPSFLPRHTTADVSSFAQEWWKAEGHGKSAANIT